jgi:uncharacterized membrane protein
MLTRRAEPEHLVALRNNDDNWTSGFYNCPDDPRIVVKGRFGIKYTVNFAHPVQAITVLIGSLGLVLAAAGIPVVLRAPQWVMYTSTLAAVIVVYAAHWWLARRDS